MVQFGIVLFARSAASSAISLSFIQIREAFQTNSIYLLVSIDSDRVFRVISLFGQGFLMAVRTPRESLVISMSVPRSELQA